ncbi:unnamed protein product [Clonostachys rosea]|uniref:Uncharacterized protein n=1 Tax=Bionectria ochroleuca TaxID=29856 RepID=A0ABY6UFV0_BIOOC|nr:unnamed protein product [Clonostachys rosea]
MSTFVWSTKKAIAYIILTSPTTPSVESCKIGDMILTTWVTSNAGEDKPPPAQFDERDGANFGSSRAVGLRTAKLQG